MSETHEHRLKRLRIRAWRRGTKEMDLILGSFADAHLDSLDSAELDALEALMAENDQALYVWMSGRMPPPEEHASMIARIMEPGQSDAK